MKGLLLAGGYGTRLRPLTFTGNKHTLPIANKPMILYGLEALRDAGVREVTSADRKAKLKVLGYTQFQPRLRGHA